MYRYKESDTAGTEDHGLLETSGQIGSHSTVVCVQLPSTGCSDLNYPSLYRTLVSIGAQRFARTTESITIVPPESLVSTKAKTRWERWKRRLETTEDASVAINTAELNAIQDTVGAVAWHQNGGVAAGVSRSLFCFLSTLFKAELPCLGFTSILQWRSPTQAARQGGPGEFQEI